MSLQHERIAAAQFVDMADSESNLFSSQPPSPLPQLFSQQAIDAHYEKVVRSNRDRFLRWRRDLQREDVERMEASGHFWVVFDSQVEPVRCGRTTQEAMQGVTDTAFLGHIINDRFIGAPEPATAALGSPRACGNKLAECSQSVRDAPSPRTSTSTIERSGRREAERVKGGGA